MEAMLARTMIKIFIVVIILAEAGCAGKPDVADYFIRSSRDMQLGHYDRAIREAKMAQRLATKQNRLATKEYAKEYEDALQELHSLANEEADSGK
jgi:hypothetical protein